MYIKGVQRPACISQWIKLPGVPRYLFKYNQLTAPFGAFNIKLACLGAGVGSEFSHTPTGLKQIFRDPSTRLRAPRSPSSGLLVRYLKKSPRLASQGLIGVP